MARRERKLPKLEAVETIVGEHLYEPLRPFMLTALWSGLRLFEVAALEPRDVQLQEDGVTLLHVRHGKGDRERWSVLFEPGVSAVHASLASRRPDSLRGASLHRGPTLFRTATGGAWDRRSVNKHWVAARRAAGWEVSLSTNFHWCTRHVYATWLLNQGVADMDVAITLGHLTRDGRPNTDEVRRRYGHPDLRVALGRVAAVAA